MVEEQIDTTTVRALNEE
jgi:hypothetical protein